MTEPFRRARGTRRGRYRFGSRRGWTAGLGIIAASLLGGVLIARETVAGMDSFYRDAVPWEWRERRTDAGPRTTEAAAVVYSPIGWGGEAIPPVPPRTDPASDDPALLGLEGDRAFAPASGMGESVEDERAAGVPTAPFGRARDAEGEPPFDFATPHDPEPAPDEVEAAPALAIASEF